MPETTLTDHVLTSAALQLLRKGRDPQSIVDQVFQTLDKAVDTHQTKRVLCCQGGSMKFSEDFWNWLFQHGHKHFSLDFQDQTKLKWALEGPWYRVLGADLVEAYRKGMGLTLEEGLRRASVPPRTLVVEHIPEHRAYGLDKFGDWEHAYATNRFADKESEYDGLVASGSV
ncbi:hypothetical protein HDV00_003918 [Rhizophlyctis rosea]|nr:hypothetical protein HDV00_003918 [Rhizophlyctis rosea]